MAQPGWLLLLLLLPLFGLGAVLVSRLRKRQWLAFAAPRLRPALLKRTSRWPRWLSLIALLLATALLIGSLARPQGDAGVRTEKALGRNVLFALDLSRSMRVSDVKPDRLSQAKVVLYELLESLPNDRVGLIGFAGRPFLFAPLTIDHSAVRETVEQIDENWAPVGGSDLASAVRLATETLKETGQRNNALIILSDGEENQGDLDAMLAEAARSGVYIFSIGVGTDAGGTVPNPLLRDSPLLDRSGQPVVSRLQPDVLRKLASETNGRFVIAGSGADIPAMVRAAVQDLDAFEVEGRERRVAVEYYQWLVLPAILLLMLSIVAGTRWRGVRPAAAAALALVAATTDVRADAISDAKEALESGRLEEARDAYAGLAESAKLPGRAARFRLGEGLAAYRANDFQRARSAFSGATLSESPEVASQAHLGMGNTLFQLGWQGLTHGETYPTDPAEVPDMERFDELVRQRLQSLMESEVPEQGETDGFARMRSMMLNWTDAVRHYQSALESDPSSEGARRNEAKTIAYLRRLDQLLQQEEQELEQALQQDGGEGEGQPQPGPQEGEPQEGDEGDQPQDGGEEPSDQDPGEGSEPEDGEGDGEEEEEGDEGDGGDEPEDQGESDRGNGDPNETPEQRARRILEENADLERGPLSPGRREFVDPEKDW